MTNDKNRESKDCKKISDKELEDVSAGGSPERRNVSNVKGGLVMIN